MKTLYPQAPSRRFPKTGKSLKLQFSAPIRLLLSEFFYLGLFIYAVLFAEPTFGQSGINSFTSVISSAPSGTSYSGTGGAVSAQSEYLPASNNTFDYNFGKNSGYTAGVRAVNGYVAGGAAFSVIANVVTGVVMRRVNNPGTGSGRDILFFAGNRNPGINTTGQTNSTLTVNLNADYVADMGVAFSQNNLLIGTDNIFSNQGNGNDNNNNIERVDVMIGGGYTIPDVTKYGFPILERGVYGAHDAFKIAVITAVDGSGTPTAYSKVLSITSANYNNTSSANPVPDGMYNYFLFRRNGNGKLKINQHITDQGIGGVALRFSDFGLANGTTIYGYSIMANDFNSTLGSDVVDYNNASRYPTNTSESIGGLDILAVLGIAMQTNILPVELASFDANTHGKTVQLDWTTVTEMYNRGFYIERSTNGKEWTSIAFVASKADGGNSTEKLQYNYYDNNPSSGSNYYRLRQVDQDNVEKLSLVKTVSFAEKIKTAVQFFPNPVINEAHIDGIEPGARCRIVDAHGSVISQFTSTASSQTIATDKLNNGVYFVQILSTNSEPRSIRFVKM